MVPRPLPSPHHSEDGTASKRKEKTFRNPLTRTKSRRDSHSKSRIDNATKHYHDQPPKTAPLSVDWPEKDLPHALRNKQSRGKSAERAMTSESDDNFHLAPKERERTGFMSGARNAVKGKSGGGNIFTRLGGKITRSGSSSHDKPVTVSDNDYKCKVINLPLVEQTRFTRISKNLDSCRDKTEYWMPALPWRCIEWVFPPDSHDNHRTDVSCSYLNQHCESEGLYRVPGSHQDIKRWQHRFDTEHDIDLLDEEINDQNCISSTLKAWLRELPTDIMPKDVQDRLAEELAKHNPDFARMGQSAPDMLRNALSELPPYNYYLLFAITCHLSLLLSQKDKNKMDLNNLSICIQPALGIDRWLFNYLVGDWRHCWQGCYTEKKFLEYEVAHANGEVVDDPTPLSQSTGVSSRTDPAYLASMSDFSRNMLRSGADERAVSSSGSMSGTSKPASQYEDARSTTAYHDDGAGMPPPPQMPENRAPETCNAPIASQSDGRADTPLRSLHTANDLNKDLEAHRTRQD